MQNQILITLEQDQTVLKTSKGNRKTMELEGKTALVTGATSGIGEAIALAFAREGAKVLIIGRNSKRGVEAVEKIIQVYGRWAGFYAADLASNRGINGLVYHAKKVLGKVDILVNNAAIFPMAPTAEVSHTTLDEVLATNVKAPFLLTAAFAPAMVERGQGKIINITSVAAHKGFAGGALYGASKAALAQLTRAWADEFGPKGVNVNAIAPHLVDTPGIHEALVASKQLLQSLPARRFATPEDVAEAAIYLAGGKSNYVHGITLPVDGGFLAI